MPTPICGEWDLPGEAVYFDPAALFQERPVAFHVPAGVRIHGAASRGYEKKSLRLYFRQEYDFNRLEYPLFRSNGLESSAPPAFKRLVVRDGGQDFGRYGWTLIRTHLVNNLAQAIGSFTPRSQPVLLFLNGQPQGIYLIQERIDERFFADRYGIETTSFDQGDRSTWFSFLDYLETADLSDPAAYAYAQSQLDVSNYIDYYALQLYSVSTDWVSPNTRNFRPDTQGGRWHGLFWDVDWTFGLVVWGDYDFDMLDWLHYQDRPDLERGSLLFRRLLENPDFRAAFLSRTADLLNTVLAPDQVLAQIDMLAAELRPDIHYEIGRWPSASDWENNVQRMRDFALRRPDALRQQLVDHLNLDGVTQLNFLPPLEGQGALAVNGILLPGEPWQGSYFRGSELNIVAVPAPGFRFVGWDAAELPDDLEITLTIDQPMSISPRFVPAGREQLRPNDVQIVHLWPEADGPQGASVELLVTRPGGIDMRGWRLTDNDTIDATDEGSLIFADDQALAHLPVGSSILIVTHPCNDGGKTCHPDDLSHADYQLVLHVGNRLIPSQVDPWFELSQQDSVALLAPGPTAAYHDDRGIAFASVHPTQFPAVTPATFGILADGVTNGMPALPH